MNGSAKLRLTIAAAVLAPALAFSPARAVPGDADSAELGLYAGQGLLDDYGTFQPDDDLLYGGRLGAFLSPNWSFEFSYQQLSSENSLGAGLDITSYRGNILYNFLRGRRFRPFLTAGLGLESTEIAKVDSNDPGANVGAGLRWYYLQNFGLRFDARFVHTDLGAKIEESQGNVEATLGAVFGWGGGPPADGDGDGVRDRRDKCAGTPQGAVVDVRGCPLDGDGDGVWDGLDACPDTGAGCPVDERGCPLDTDLDGVIDCNDKCPGTPQGCAVDEQGCAKDEDGDGVCDGVDTCAGTAAKCPVDATGCPTDEDGDGVIDCEDKCRGTVKGCAVDATGCPQDEDGDGLCDGLDQCPGTPAGRTVDEKGCAPLFVEKAKLVLEGVTFETDSAKLAPESRETLDSVAASLRAWSEIKVEIEGHTDASGSDAHNLELSQRRAESVRDYLVSQGIDAARLVAKGYGESAPVGDNETAEGRARNRRVELKKLN